jgi:4-amino-4-deoxy-L-arabinose transferase-like glycosyltransferase
MRLRGFLLPLGWLAFLAFYVGAGITVVPFHGDEATVIWISRDFDYLMRGDFERLTYHDPPIHLEEQQLRLLNGTVNRNLIGLSRLIAGYDVDQINNDWLWHLDWDANIANGAKPSDDLLHLARIQSVLLTIGSVGLMFGIGWHITGKWGAYIASALYTFNPAVLLNGRRAMFEGSQLFFTLLIVLLALFYWRHKKGWLAIAIGVTAGLALSSKHPSLIVLVAVFLPFMFQKPTRRAIIQLLMIGFITCGVFFLLNPIWWGNPFERVQHVLDMRSFILDIQQEQYGSYANLAEQTIGFIQNTFAVTPQYFEVQAWENYIAEPITAYHQTGLSGVHYGTIGGIIIFLMMAVGLWRCWVKKEWVVLSWACVVLITLWWITPFNWQRYYVLTYPPVSILFAMGIIYLGEKTRHLIAHHP